MRILDADSTLDAITATIVERFAPERVILFGSRARGDHRAESDYDIIIVLDTPLPREERDRPLRDAVRAPGIDFIVYTPAEYERSRTDVGALAYAGDTEGRVLYDRRPPRAPRSVREQGETVPASYVAWASRAEADFAAIVDIERGSRSPDAIAFHAHQGAEKLLKALLIREHVPPPRTHVLSDLLDRSARLRHHERARHCCATLDALWPKMRYPESVPPTHEEAAEAAATARELRDLLVGEAAP